MGAGGGVGGGADASIVGDGGGSFSMGDVGARVLLCVCLLVVCV